MSLDALQYAAWLLSGLATMCAIALTWRDCKDERAFIRGARQLKLQLTAKHDRRTKGSVR